MFPRASCRWFAVLAESSKMIIERRNAAEVSSALHTDDADPGAVERRKVIVLADDR